MYGLTVPNLTGGIAVMNTNHHLTKPVLIGEILEDGQFEIVYETPAGVIGDAWTDFLPESANIVATILADSGRKSVHASPITPAGVS